MFFRYLYGLAEGVFRRPSETDLLKNSVALESGELEVDFACVLPVLLRPRGGFVRRSAECAFVSRALLCCLTLQLFPLTLAAVFIKAFLPAFSCLYAAQ